MKGGYHELVRPLPQANSGNREGKPDSAWEGVILSGQPKSWYPRTFPSLRLHVTITVTHQSSFEVPEGRAGLVNRAFEALRFCWLINLFGYLREKMWFLEMEIKKWNGIFHSHQKLCVENEVKGMRNWELWDWDGDLKNVDRSSRSEPERFQREGSYIWRDADPTTYVTECQMRILGLEEDAQDEKCFPYHSTFSTHSAVSKK